jgi:hypothetical protein
VSGRSLGAYALFALSATGFHFLVYAGCRGLLRLGSDGAWSTATVCGLACFLALREMLKGEGK